MSLTRFGRPFLGNTRGPEQNLKSYTLHVRICTHAHTHTHTHSMLTKTAYTARPSGLKLHREPEIPARWATGQREAVALPL